MRRQNAWTLRALRALLACLCVFFASPIASSSDPSLRPVAAAFAAPSTVAAATVAAEQSETAAPLRAGAPACEPPETLPTAPANLAVPNRRRLYLAKRSLLC
jgi:predicted permease